MKLAWRKLDMSLWIDNIVFKILIFLKMAERVYDLDVSIDSVVSFYLQEDAGYQDMIDAIADCKKISGLPIPLYSVLNLMKKSIDDALSLLSERDREILLTCFLYQEENKHLPDEVLSELSNRYSTTPANIRQIKKRALDKIKAHIIQNSTCQTIKS